MKKIFLILLTCIAATTFSFGQGTVQGNVRSNIGDALSDVSISLKSKPSVKTKTDSTGNYSLFIPDSTAQTMVLSLDSYTTKEEIIPALTGGQTITKDVVFVKPISAAGPIVIRRKVVKANDTYMEKVQQNSSVTMSYISAATMGKTGDANITQGVARVSGVSTSGGLITVRGIGDRYVKTTFNGSRIPTLDPFTNNIRLDMFPAALVDNIVISKTASPDLPGDWAGAYISVETKDYPKKLTVNIETAFGYNDQSTFKNVLSSQHSPTDWLGYDNGFRDHSMGGYALVNYTPTKYDEFVALGKGDYLKSIGVTNNEIYKADSKTYDKLVYAQLGLLGSSEFNNDAAVAAAEQKYKSAGYPGTAFKLMNADAVKFNQSLPNNWSTTTRNAPLNATQSFSFGNEVKLFKKPLGFIVGFRYASATQYDPNSGYARITDPPKADGTFESSYIDTVAQKVTRESNEWSALVNLNYKYHKNHSLSFLFMPNVNGANNVAFAVKGTQDGEDIHRQFYESRKQFIYQLKSEHFIPWHKIKIEGNASYTDGSSIVPDFKVYNVFSDPSLPQPPGNNSSRFYRYLNESVFDSRVFAEMPLKGNQADTCVRIIKIGGAYQQSNRNYDQYSLSAANSLYGAAGIDFSQMKGGDPLSLDKFGFFPAVVDGDNTFRTARLYFLDERPYNHIIGRGYVSGAFAMADYTIVPRLRVSGGLRVEHAYLYSDAKLFDSLHLANSDPRRFINVAGGGFVTAGKLENLNFLPSISAIYKIKKDPNAPINVRFNFSQTVARPSLREITSSPAYDYELNSKVNGNPNLKSVNINNYDVRLEAYFKSGDNVTLSLFYKEFTNYIELFLNSQGEYTWANNPNVSWLKGVELEGKKNITKYFEVRANVTFVDSRSTFTIKVPSGVPGQYVDGETSTRTLFGQAPFMVNSIVSYKSDSLGLQATLSYNIQGPKLVITNFTQIPDVYELPRNVFDFKVSKKIGKYFTASLRVNDILNTVRRRAYKYNGQYVLDYDKYQFGRTYVFSVAYKF